MTAVVVAEKQLMRTGFGRLPALVVEMISSPVLTQIRDKVPSYSTRHSCAGEWLPPASSRHAKSTLDVPVQVLIVAANHNMPLMTGDEVCDPPASSRMVFPDGELKYVIPVAIEKGAKGVRVPVP